ncbi:hypothetical protein B0T18DRAFT_125240 [Schizothecium vesticola]|uniref:Uncharacterized protein n=1 Tax=Schizothecium vesticola TaxID=314040 RepID=A0AA40F3I0_9PEZI|nr:hypothetical protein B0T18DRAFT_125240 [Schizothecium vesticola]
MTKLTCISHLLAFFPPLLLINTHTSLQHPGCIYLRSGDPSPLPLGDPASEASDDDVEAAAAAALRARHLSHIPCNRRMRFPRCCSTRDMDRPEPHAGRATGGKHWGAGLISTSPIWVAQEVQRVRVMVWHISVVDVWVWLMKDRLMVCGSLWVWKSFDRLTVFDLFFVWRSPKCIYSSQGDSETTDSVASPPTGNGLPQLYEGSKKLFGCPAGLSSVCCCFFCSCGRPCCCMVVVGQRGCGPQGRKASRPRLPFARKQNISERVGL